MISEKATVRRVAFSCKINGLCRLFWQALVARDGSTEQIGPF